MREKKKHSATYRIDLRSRLTPIQRKIIELRAKGWTYGEIAEEIGCSGTYVYQILKRAGKTKSKAKKTRRAS